MPKQNVFTSARLNQSFARVINPDILQQIKNRIVVPTTLEYEEHQALLETQLNLDNYVALMEKERIEAKKRKEFEQYHCLRCLRYSNCEKLGTVTECALFNDEDSDFVNQQIENNRNRDRIRFNMPVFN